MNLSDEETGAQLQVLIALSLYKNCIILEYVTTHIIFFKYLSGQL